MGGFHGGHGGGHGGFHGGGHHSSSGSHGSRSSSRSGGGGGALLVYLIYGLIKLLAYLFGLEINERKPLNWKQFLAIAITSTGIVVLFFFFGLGVKVTGTAVHVKLNNYSDYYSSYSHVTSHTTEYYTIEYEMYGKTYSYDCETMAIVEYSYGHLTKVDNGVEAGDTFDVYPVIANPNMRIFSYNIVGYIITFLAIIVAIRFYIMVFKERKIHDKLLLQIGDINGDGCIDDKDIIEYNLKSEERENDNLTPYAKNVQRRVDASSGKTLKCPLCDARLEATDISCPICGWKVQEKTSKPTYSTNNSPRYAKDVQTNDNAKKGITSKCPLCDARLEQTDKSCPICGWRK